MLPCLGCWSARAASGDPADVRACRAGPRSRARGSVTGTLASARGRRRSWPLRASAASRRSSASRQVVRQSPTRTRAASAVNGCSKPSRALCRNWRSRPWRPGVPVARIAGDRMADRGEVGADLVRAAGLQAGLDQGVGGQRLEHREVGARRRGRRGRGRRASRGRGGRGRAARRSCPCASAGGPRPAPGRCARPRGALIIAASRRCASSSRATTISPEVSLSRRWTIPGRSGLAAAEQLAEHVDQGRRRGARAPRGRRGPRACRPPPADSSAWTTPRLARSRLARRSAPAGRRAASARPARSPPRRR